MHRLLEKAFTLIELLVVIAIIGILSGLIVVTMSGAMDRANIAKSQVFSNSLRNSLLNNLIVELKLDGNSSDTWGSIPAGTITGATSNSSDCVYGSCYSFNGANGDNISFGDQSVLSFTNNIFTIGFWMKRSSATSSTAVLGKTNGASSPYEYGIYSSNGTTLYCWSWNSSGNSVYGNSTTIDNDGWNFYVWTANGSTSYLYKNGVKGTAGYKTSYSMQDTTAPFVVGRGCDGGSCRYHNGSLDDIRIYAAAMPAFLIKEQYYAGLNNLLRSHSISKEEYNQRISQLSINN